MADDEHEREQDSEDSPLTAEEILTFGPCVEAQVWTPVWVQESRAPIAVQAGRPKLGPVFNSDGVGKAAIIRPCVSRGRRLRGLPPVYTPQMLEANAGVFDGWPMFTDHVPAELQASLAKRGRSVKDLGGQLLTGRWHPTFVHEDDERYGYRKGAVVGDVWATKMIRETVGENPNLLHTSINAWPTSGKPGPVPWRPNLKGMVIEGIRRQPQGSVDFVVRGGAGGRLLVAEAAEDEGAWPEIGEWSEEDRRFVVSVAERLYASPRMADIALPTKPEELHDWLAEHAEHLLPALEAAASNDDDADDKPKRGKKRSSSNTDTGMTESDVRELIAEASSGQPTVEEFTESLEERVQERLNERDHQRHLSQVACELIESAEAIPPSWKADLKVRYSMLPSGPPVALLVESDHGQTDENGNELSEEQVLLKRVRDDLAHTRQLIQEAQGRPRVKGEGGSAPDPAADKSGLKRSESSFWRDRFAEMGVAESDEKALEIFGEKAEG